MAGELIAVDHINRIGVLRVDRTDAQRRPGAKTTSGTVVAVKMEGRQCLVTVGLARPDAALKPAALVRLWVDGD